jgi:hypothetical protein
MPEALLNTPQERHAAYEDGLIGAYLIHEDSPSHIKRQAEYDKDKFFGECNVKRFSEIVPSNLQGISKGKRAFAWANYYKNAPKKALKGAQKTGDCVSWAKRTSVDCTRSNEAVTNGFAYIEHGATALIYRSRGDNGQGMSGYRAAETIQKYGILFEKKYLDGKYDFTNYDDYLSWAMNGRGGLPEDLTQITSQTRIEQYAVIKSADELADSIFLGYPPDCCSGIGVSSSSDEKGLSKLRGSWSHDMGIVGYDDTREIWPFRVYIWDQSWGLWNKQITHEIYKKICEALGITMPEGYFILSEEDTMRAVRQDGTIACSSTVGFPKLTLPDLGALGHV